MGTSQSTSLPYSFYKKYPSGYYVTIKVCDNCCKHWKDFKIPLGVYDDNGNCMLTFEQALEFSFKCHCEHINEVDFMKACSPSTVVYLKKRAELDRIIRENEIKIYKVQKEKEEMQLTLCELNQLKIKKEIDFLKNFKIDLQVFCVLFRFLDSSKNNGH